MNQPAESRSVRQATEQARSRSHLNHLVFWPPFLLLLAAIALNFLSPDYRDAETGELIRGGFYTAVNAANSWILNKFGWLFTTCALLSVSLCVTIAFTRFGKIKLGGEDAEPLMSRWNWFAITICTTIAIGILFWSTAEPVSHLMQPPQALGLEPGSDQAATFALSTMYLHWSFTPYSIYAVASLMFAFSYYNLRQPFSLSSTVTPLFGNKVYGHGGTLIDAVCLYALVAGMAAALGAGILMIAGGLNDLFGIPSNQWTWAAIAATIVITFVISSATGLMQGIRILSDINTKLLFGLLLVPLLFGPGLKLLGYVGPALADYVIHFVPRHLDFVPDQWAKGWTVFYWAVWLAWAPITACFLGRIAYGRTVREFLLINLVLPSLFAIVWMSVFSGTAIELQQSGQTDLYAVLQQSGSESVSFAVFNTFPWATALIVFYITSSFICFVTSSDSNMTAMASISSTGITPESPEGNLWLKILWGTTVGAVSWVMISFTGGVDGVKILSNLGGFPAAILQLLIIASLAKVVLFYEVESRRKQGA